MSSERLRQARSLCRVLVTLAGSLAVRGNMAHMLVTVVPRLGCTIEEAKNSRGQIVLVLLCGVRVFHVLFKVVLS